MNKIFISFTFAFLIALSFETGGWVDINSNLLDEGYQAALPIAIDHIKVLVGSNITLNSIESAQVQIVAGMNYKFVLNFDIGRFEVVVWRKVDGSYKVTSANKLKGLGVGGWTLLDVNNLEYDAKEASDFAVVHGTNLLSNSGIFSQIVDAQKQIVAGVNYKFHLEFTGRDGNKTNLEIVVWKKLDGTYVVTSADAIN